jgi:putative oxidoreductase
MLSGLEKYRPQMLSVLRIFVGLLFLQAGLSKYFGWPGPQPKDFTTLLHVAGAIELVGGVLMALGLWTREAAFIMSGEMAVAYFLRRIGPDAANPSFFPAVNGGTVEALFCFVFLYLVFAGAGPWSVDANRARR